MESGCQASCSLSVEPESEVTSSLSIDDYNDTCDLYSDDAMSHNNVQLSQEGRLNDSLSVSDCSLEMEKEGSLDSEEEISGCSDNSSSEPEEEMLGFSEDSSLGLESDSTNYPDLFSVEDGDDVEIDPRMFQPLYENALITVCGAFVAIMEFKRSCHLPFSCIEKLLNLLQLLCPANNSLPRSVYSLRKFFSTFSAPRRTRNFCSDCHTEIEEEQNKCSRAACRRLQPSMLTIFNPIKAIKRVLKRNWPVLLSSSQVDSVLCDLNTQGSPGIIFNTDGVSPFKSSSITIWPLIIAFSNLPRNIRMNKDNLVIVALWVGEFKPPMNILFEPLHLFRQLSTQGIALQTTSGTTTLKFYSLIGLFDLVAKAPILNMNQFNGVNGCPTCLHPGTWLSSRYYLPDTEYPLRTNNSVMKSAHVAEMNNCIVDGIKGQSVLTNVVDLVKNVPMDYMHCVLEGVTKWLVGKWFTSTNHRSSFYIGRQIKNVDKQLLCQCPPHDFSRAPRSMEKHRKYWKASEFRYWLLYYSLPILVHILPPLYLHHFALLVCAMHILLQSTLKEAQIKAAEEMLKDYYLMLPELYGDTSCTLNAHSLIHLTMYVRLWGPLWTHSLFGFESFNGTLTSMIHSKYRVAEQLSFSVDVTQAIGNLADKLVEFENEQTLNFLSPMSSVLAQPRSMSHILPGIYSIGKLLPADFTHEEILALQQCSSTVTLSEIKVFKKLYFHDTILHSTQKERKRDSSNCCYVVQGIKEYGVIQKFCFSPPMVLIKPYKRTASSLLKTAGDPCRERLREYQQHDLLSSFFIEVSSLLPVCAVPISAISCKCIRVCCSNSPYDYVIHIPNSFEHT